MAARKPNWQSDRSSEDIARSRQVRLQARVLKTLLRTNARDEAIGVFLGVINDPAAKPRTRNAAAQPLAAAVGRVLPQQGPKVHVDARHQALTAAGQELVRTTLSVLTLVCPKSPR